MSLRLKDFQFNHPLIIITSNLVPLIGVLFFRWDAFNIVAMFFIEFLIIQMDFILRYTVSNLRSLGVGALSMRIAMFFFTLLTATIFTLFLYYAFILAVSIVAVFFILGNHPLIPMDYLYATIAIAVSYLVTLIIDQFTETNFQAMFESMFAAFEHIDRMGALIVAFSILLPTFFLVQNTILRLILAIAFKIGLELYAARKNAIGSPTSNDPLSQMKRSLRYLGQMK